MFPKFSFENSEFLPCFPEFDFRAAGITSEKVIGRTARVKLLHGGCFCVWN